MREVCASAVVRLADALLDNGHAEAEHAGSMARAIPACHAGLPHRETDSGPGAAGRGSHGSEPRQGRRGFGAALSSPEAQAALADLPNFAGGGYQMLTGPSALI